MRLKIDFTESLFDSSVEQVQQAQLATACKVWKEAFLREQGPWGFGIAADVGCRVKKPGDTEKYKQLKNFDHWLLTIEKDKVENNDAISLNLCRVKINRVVAKNTLDFPEEKCEARRVIPWTEFRVRLLRHRAFVRLLAASMLDQLPYLSVVTKNLLNPEQTFIRGYPEVQVPEVSFPAAPANISFADVRYIAAENRFQHREIPLKEAISRAIKQTGVVWILNKDGRGGKFNDYTRRINDAFVALKNQFQEDLLKLEREQLAQDGDNLKAKAKWDLTTRADVWFGLPLFSMRSSFGAGANAALQSGYGYGAALGANYAMSKYTLGTEVQEKDNTNKISQADVELSEFSLWLQPQLVRSVRQYIEFIPFDASLRLGLRMGLLSSEGSFKTEGVLPENQLSIKAQELVWGGDAGFEIPVGSSLVLRTGAHLDVGLRASSSSFGGLLEGMWILKRLPLQPGGERPPDITVGGSAHFNTLSRRFVTRGAARTIETQATLNGMQVSVFVEKLF